jgi:hypothetical protein
MNFTNAIFNIIDYLPWMQGAPSDSAGDQSRGDHLGTTLLDDPQREPAANSSTHLLTTLTHELLSSLSYPDTALLYCLFNTP